MCLNAGYFPKCWKKGILNTLFKHGSQNDPNNYRGITLCSILGKLLSSIHTKRIQSALLGQIDPLQGGFREDHQTSDNIFILTEIIKLYRAKHVPVYACFIDFAKAFDRVIRPALLIKLIKYGLGGNFYKLIKSMYEGDEIAIKIENKLTDYFTCNMGVRQGCISGPSCFTCSWS